MPEAEHRPVVRRTLEQDFDPPHWTSVQSNYAGSRLLYQGAVSELPMPGLRVPDWARPLGERMDIARILVGLRALLAPEALFASEIVEEPATSGGMIMTDLVLPRIHADDHGLPNVPHVTSPTWPSVAIDLIVAGWFAHLQQVAELTQSALVELELAHLTSAAATARVALEGAARLNLALRDIADSASDECLDVAIKWFVAGPGTNDNVSRKTDAVEALVATAREWHNLPAALLDELSGLYGRLCDHTHPGEMVWANYIAVAHAGRVIYPPLPVLDDLTKAPAVRMILQTVALAASAVQDLRPVAARVLAELRGRGGSGSVHLYRSEQTIDLLAAYPYVDASVTLMEPLHKLAWYSRFNDDHLPLTGNRVAREAVTRATAGRAWPIHDAIDGTALSAVRLVPILELEGAVVRALNRGNGATAAANARFLLEHLDFEIKSRTGGKSRGRHDRLVQLLRRVGLPQGERGSEGARLLHHAMNGMVHGDLQARSLYWAMYGSRERGALRLPGRPSYPRSVPDRLDNPWVGSVAVLLVAEHVLLMSAQLTLRGRKAWDSL